jgi:hypothetical protein
MPSSARIAISIALLVENAAIAESDGERGRADQQELAPADAVAERAHRDQEAGDEKAVDVDDPEQLCAGRPECGADRRQREVQDREVHRVDRARQRDDGEADPFAGGRAGLRVGGRHRMQWKGVQFGGAWITSAASPTRRSSDRAIDSRAFTQTGTCVRFIPGRGDNPRLSPATP